MWMTGDEPRYVASGLGMYTGGRQPNAHTWQAFVARSALPIAPYPFALIDGHPAPSWAPGVVFGFPLLALGLDGARWVDLAIGCLGLVVLWEMLRKRFPIIDARSYAIVATTVACIAFAVPFVAYVRLLYPEVLLFTTIACALFAIAETRWIWAILAAGLLPVEHIRALPISLAFFAIVLWDCSRARENRARTITLAALYVTTLGAWAFAQFHTYGSLAGPAFSTTSPAIGAFFPRLGIQLFDVRHGLLTYAPVFVIGFAGLVAGAMRRDRLCLRAGIILLAYVGTFVWSSAGESWSARFWVAALPMLGLGVATWLAQARTRPAAIAFGICAAITLANTIIYALHPMWYVQNRTTSFGYAAIGAFLHVDIGRLFLVDDGRPEVAHAYAALFALGGTIAALTIAAQPSRREF